MKATDWVSQICCGNGDLSTVIWPVNQSFAASLSLPLLPKGEKITQEIVDSVIAPNINIANECDVIIVY